MNNPKMFEKVISVALVLAMLVSSFSLFTLGASAEGSGFMDVTQNGDEFACTYVCDDCGDTVTVPAELLKSYSDFTTTGATKPQGLPTSVQGTDKDPYRIDFTVNVIEVPDDQTLLTKLYNGNQGRNVLNYNGTVSGQSGTKNPATLRQLPVSDGNGGYKNDEIEIKISDGGTNGANYVSLGTVKEGKSMDITFICTPADFLIEIYADGEYVGTRTSEQSFQLQNIRFFDTAANGAATLKISGLKVIRSGEDTHAKTCFPVTTEPFDGCWHEPSENEIIEPKTGDDGLYYTYVCGKCGETVDKGLTEFMIEDVTLGADKRAAFNLPAEIIGADKDPYQIDFTITFKTASSKSYDTLYNSGSGRSLVNYSNPRNDQLFRQFPVSGETDKVTIVAKDNQKLIGDVVTLQLGEGNKNSVDITLVANPAEGTVKIYADGAYIGTNTTSANFDQTQLRFGDSSGGCGFDFSNIRIIQPVAESHKHTYNWGGADNSLNVLDNNTIEYSFTCYCGETFTAGIQTVLEDSIAPMYNTESATALFTLPEIANTKIAAFAGNMAIKTLPADGVKALVSFGETAVMSVGADGVIYVGETATDLVLPENAADYKAFALYLSANICTVYFEGEKLGSVEFAAEAELVIGSEGMGTVHFDSMVLATLAVNSNNTYNVVENDHEHSFDDIRNLFLEANEARTAVTATYDCLICGRPASLGITANLYDGLIPTVMDTAKGAVIIDSLSDYTDGSYWFSADFVVSKFVRLNCQPIVSLGDMGILLVDADGTLTLNNREYTEVGSVKAGERFNVALNVEVDGETSNVLVFLNGIYCGEYALDFVPETVTAGGAKAPSYTVDAIKLMTIGVGGTVEIETFACDAHVYDYSKAVFEYLDSKTFTVTNKCLECGLTVVEKPAHNFYEGAMPAIYNGVGEIKLPFAEPDEAYDSFWTVADVNVRDNNIGSFSGYKNLIAIDGFSIVLVNDKLNLAFGDGTSMEISLDEKATNNIAVQVVASEGVVNVYVDGTYAGSVNASGLAKIESEAPHTFGAEGLENILFYNIRSFVADATGESVNFEYEDVELIDCMHIVGEAERESIVLFGDAVEYSYSCSECGQIVSAKSEGKNLYDKALNDSKTNGLKFDENGTALLNARKYIYFNTQDIGRNSAPFWIKFDITLLDFDEAKFASSGNLNFMDIRTNYERVLRWHYDNADDHLLVRVAKAVDLGNLYIGEKNNIAIFIDTATDKCYAYFNGEYAGSASGVLGTDASVIDGAKGIRLIDSFISFELSNFNFIADSAAHTHTDAKSEEMGLTPTLKYGDATLGYTFKCICGETVTAGIDEIYADSIANLTGVTKATAIAEAADAEMPNKPYWVSARVYATGDTAVYSYGENEIVGIVDGVYTIGGVATEIVPSGIKLAGDYDVVSVQIAPADGKAYVYINGKLVGTTDVAIEDYAKFDILLGGGASADFKFIKVVSLAVGANKEVTNASESAPALEFEHGKGVTVETTSTGLTFTTKDGGERTVTIGNGPIYTKDSKTVTGSGTLDNKLGDYNGTIFNTEIGDKFYLTFNMTTTGFTLKESDGVQSFISWKLSASQSWFSHLIRIKNDGGVYRVVLGDGNIDTSAVIEANTKYSFVFEFEYIRNSNMGTFTKNIATCNVYMNGEYIGATEVTVARSDSSTNDIRLNTTQVGGTATYTDIKLYKPESDKFVPSAIVGPGETPDGGETPEACVHFPDVTKELSKTIEVKDGFIKQVFICKNCGEKIELGTMNKIVDGDFDSMLADVSVSQYIELGDKVAVGTAPFIVSFDLSADVINLDTIIASGTNGKSLSVIQSRDENGKANGWTHLVRAFGHVCNCEDVVHEDKDGDGFADGVIELRCLNNKKNSNPVLAVMGISDTVNLTYVIDATNFTIEIYVNGTYKHTSNSVNIASDDICVRVGESDIGGFDFDNLRIVRMTDICEHVGPSCKDGAFGKCANCDVVVEATHNYVAQTDRTGMWTKYTCGDCGTHYVVFNDMSLVANLTFATKSELLNYLTQTYYPVF